jgi:Ca2+-binding EF-hand superfamily protein
MAYVYASMAYAYKSTAYRYDASVAQDLMRELDADGDGEVTQEEWKEGMLSSCT